MQGPSSIARTLFLSVVGLAACSGASDPAPAPASPGLAITTRDGAAITFARIDDPVTVRASGLVPGERVSLHATMDPWQASAEFIAAADGTVATDRDAPAAGSYVGIDPDGLFWSMDTPSFRFAASADVVFELVRDGVPLASATLARSRKVEGLVTIKITDSDVVGNLYLPPGSGRRPALLAFGGSEGGIDGGIGYASELVPEGYAVLAVAYFGEPGLPSDLHDVPLEYLDRALDWLEARPEIDASRIGVIGGSRGGELALLLAARRGELRAAVADSPSGYVWGATAVGTGAAWTSGGQPLPSIPAGGTSGEEVQTPSGEAAIAFRPMFLDDLAKASEVEREAARIRIENANAAIAIFAGADDQLWPACQLGEVAYRRLVEIGHAATHPDRLDCFADAGHLVSVIGLPTTHSAWAPFDETLLALGGTPAGIAHAGRARQARLRAFLNATLGAP
jgi:pimeloyl-ACP methyl ester carboxylesterase